MQNQDGIIDKEWNGRIDSLLQHNHPLKDTFFKWEEPIRELKGTFRVYGGVWSQKRSAVTYFATQSCEIHFEIGQESSAGSIKRLWFGLSSWCLAVEFQRGSKPESVWKEQQRSKWNNIAAKNYWNFYTRSAQRLLFWWYYRAEPQDKSVCPSVKKSNFEQNKTKPFGAQGLIFSSGPVRFF